MGHRQTDIHKPQAMDPPAVKDVRDLAGDFVDSSQLLPFTDNEADEIALSIVPQIKDLLSKTTKTQKVLDELFHSEAFWRDQVSLSWSLRTFHPTRCDPLQSAFNQHQLTREATALSQRT